MKVDREDLLVWDLRDTKIQEKWKRVTYTRVQKIAFHIEAQK